MCVFQCPCIISQQIVAGNGTHQTKGALQQRMRRRDLGTLEKPCSIALSLVFQMCKEMIGGACLAVNVYLAMS